MTDIDFEAQTRAAEQAIAGVAMLARWIQADGPDAWREEARRLSTEMERLRDLQTAEWARTAPPSEALAASWAVFRDRLGALETANEALTLLRQRHELDD